MFSSKLSLSITIGLEPYAWLTYVLKQLPELGPGDGVEHLLTMNLTPADIRQA